MFRVDSSFPFEFDVFWRIPFSGVLDRCPLILGRAGGSLLECLLEPDLLVFSCLFLYLLVKGVSMLELLVVSGCFLVLDKLEGVIGDPRFFGLGGICGKASCAACLIACVMGSVCMGGWVSLTLMK